MTNAEIRINQYSTKKLIEIVQEQSNAYHEFYIDLVKNEIIRRGEKFPLDKTLKKEVEEMSDSDLKKLVEVERENYHLEYIELAIGEYLKRGFKNETEYQETEIESEPNNNESLPYPALRMYSGLYVVLGLISFAEILVVLFEKTLPTWVQVFLISICVLSGIFMLASAEAIKVFLAIEANTRKQLSK